MAGDVIDAAASAQAILSTADQIEQELLAARIFAHPAFQRALEALESVARAYPQFERPAGASTWRRALPELAFASVIKAVNLEGPRGHVIWDQNVALRRGSDVIPGSRSYGNNPDNIYRRIPVDPAEHYVLRGRLRDPRPCDVSFSVLPSYKIEHGWRPVTLDPVVLADADGWFEITLDATDGGGSPGHMQLPPASERLTVRDTMLDWATDVPMELHVTRQESDGATRRIDVDALAERLADDLPAYLHHHLRLVQPIFYARKPNHFVQPAMAPSGGLTTQAFTSGSFALLPGDALVVEANPMGARYLSVQLVDPWMFALNYWEQTGNLNSFHADADEDGKFRFVIAAEDPGVHNWIDSDGLDEGGVAIRWQALSGQDRAVVPAPLIANVRPLRNLRGELPAGTRWLTDGQRDEQRSQRRGAHARRFFL